MKEPKKKKKEEEGSEIENEKKKKNGKKWKNEKKKKRVPYLERQVRVYISHNLIPHYADSAAIQLGTRQWHVPPKQVLRRLADVFVELEAIRIATQEVGEGI
jgi:hypothetical protein